MESPGQQSFAGTGLSLEKDGRQCTVGSLAAQELPDLRTKVPHVSALSNQF
jgi:hypothetical protein